MKAWTIQSSLVCVLIFTVYQFAFAGENSEDSQSIEIQYYEPIPGSTLIPDLQKSTISRCSIEAFDWDIQLVLESNDRLIADLPKETRTKLLDICKLYRGYIAGVAGSWVRLTVTGERWSGMIWDGSELYLVDPTHAVNRLLKTGLAQESLSHNVIYKLSDVVDLNPQSCGLGPFSKARKPIIDYSRMVDRLRDIVSLKAAGASLNLDIAVVADVQFSEMQDSFGNSTAAAIAARVNIVDGIYSEQVGVQIRLADIVELTDNGSMTSSDPETLLDQFSTFTASSGFDNPGVAHFFTGRKLDGDVVGIAFVSALCSQRFAVGVEEIREDGSAGALLFAHELGHNFGAPHDNEPGSPCADTEDKFLMNPILNGMDEFSTCSVDQMESVINSASCLTDIQDNEGPSVTITGPTDGRFLKVGKTIDLNSTASDAEDGNLGDDVTWRSDMDGNLGKGKNISVVLSENTHRITASVTDSDDLKDTESITIAVVEGLSDTVLFKSNFNKDNDGFEYMDDVFGGTDEPDYAKGGRMSDGGFSDDGLEVTLGGIDSENISGMSGGWMKEFSLDDAQNVTLTFRYKLTQTGEYEDDEFSQALLALDDDLVMINGRDHLAEIRGDGDGGPEKTTGWVPVGIDLGTLSAGPHSITIGAYNDEKSFRNESTEFLIDDVTIRTDGSSSGDSEIIFEHHFDSDKENFSFKADTFRNTNQPAYANGSYAAKSSFSGGGLKTVVGGVDDDDILDMSGGWRRSFTLDSSRKVTLSFRYKLTQSQKYDTGENSEALLSLDGKLVGTNSDGTLARINGKNQDRFNKTTGWVLASIDLGQLSGKHEIIIGAFNNIKTYHSEFTEMIIDDVVLTAQ